MSKKIFNFKIIFIFIIGLFIHGCVIIPVPLPEKMVSGIKVPDENLSFIEIGVTTKAEVSHRLPPPDVILPYKNLFVYEWKTRWGVAVLVLPGGGWFHRDINDDQLLIIQFDESDRVKRIGNTMSNFD